MFWLIILSVTKMVQQSERLFFHISKWDKYPQILTLRKVCGIKDKTG